jgi:enoyl-CoA hydratase/carnithine racemase
MTYIQVDCDRQTQGSVYRLTVSRPQRLNALDSHVLNEMAGALAAIAADEDARVAVLGAAEGKAWIAGADIDEMANLDRHNAAAFVQRLHGVCRTVRELPVPVIARISGYCLGGGLELAASCDLRIASDDSRFGMPEVQIGLPSVIEAAVLPRLVGLGRARELVLTGRLIDAHEACAWGLVEAVVPRADLDALVLERVQQIVSAAPQAIRMQKVLCRRWEELPLSAAITESIDAFVRAYESDEPRMYMERFFRGRKNK